MSLENICVKCNNPVNVPLESNGPFHHNCPYCDSNYTTGYRYNSLINQHIKYIRFNP